MSDFIPLSSPGGRAFSRAAFLTPEDLATFQQEVGESSMGVTLQSVEGEEAPEVEEGQDLEDVTEAEGEPGELEPSEGERMYTQEEVSRLQTESFQLGVVEGREKADIETERLKAEVSIVENLAEELEGLRRRMVAGIHGDIGELVLYASRRVVGETLAVHPPALMKLVEGAMERLPGDDEVSIVVRPEAADMVRSLLATRRSFVIEEDATLEGGCMVSSSVGAVEASLEAAFEGLSQAVADWVEDQR